MQNISKHEKEQNGIASGIFLMGKKNDRYVFGSGNLIENSEIEELSKHLANLNGMNSEELSSYYKRTLRSGVTTKTGGAGLGLLEIARESHDSLLYDFTEIDDSTSFFSLIAAL